MSTRCDGQEAREPGTVRWRCGVREQGQHQADIRTVTIASTTTYACAPCEVTWALADGVACWSCGNTATLDAFVDTTRPPRTLTSVSVAGVQAITQAEIVRAHAMGLPDPRTVRG
jgi:hypothetical protein